MAARPVVSLILVVGAWTVMTEPAFTLGMLLALQMFAGKLSQPVLNIKRAGIWLVEAPHGFPCEGDRVG